jgi:DNA primase
MRLITKGGIERLLSANPIAEVAAEHGIALVALGSSLLVGRCPLERATTGKSLLIEPTSGCFRCLTCWAHGGNVIGFVIQLDRVPFLAALELLAARAGLDLDAIMAEPARPKRAASEVPLWALTPPPGLVFVELEAQ